MGRSNQFAGAFDYRLDPSLGPKAVLFNDICTILAAATRDEEPSGDFALALGVLSNLSSALLFSLRGERRQLLEMSEWSCIAGQRANASIEIL